MLKVAVVRFPGSNCDFDTLRAAERVGARCLLRLAPRHRPAGRRRRDPARRVQLRRLPPLRRHRPVQPDHAGGPAPRGRRRRRCSASATGSRSCARRTCCPARCCGTRGSPSSPSRWTSWSSGPTPRSPRPTQPGDAAAPAGGARRRPVRGAPTTRCACSRPKAGSCCATWPPPRRSPLQPNPNGSANHIAGICNAAGTVVGIMPHPERVADRAARRCTDGLGFFTSLAAWQPQRLHAQGAQPMTYRQAQPQRRRILRPAGRRAAAASSGPQAEAAAVDAERKTHYMKCPKDGYDLASSDVPRRPDRDLPPLRRHVARRRRARRGGARGPPGAARPACSPTRFGSLPRAPRTEDQR